LIKDSGTDNLSLNVYSKLRVDFLMSSDVSLCISPSYSTSLFTGIMNTISRLEN